MAQPGFHPSENFDLSAMGAFMRQPAIYGPIHDAMAPAPETVQLEEHMLDPRIWTMAAMYGDHIVGYVQINKRTSIAGEYTVGFHPQVPGVAKKAFCLYGIHQAWNKLGMVTLWALIPSDSRPSRVGAYLIGFRPEAVLRKAMSRPASRWAPSGIRDLVVYSIHRPEA